MPSNFIEDAAAYGQDGWTSSATQLAPLWSRATTKDGRAFRYVQAVADTVAGSVYQSTAPIALHLARHGRIEFGQEIEIHQGAEIDRPSTLYAVARSETEIEVGGSAVVVARGEFRL